jgi:hypothetical protein
MSNWRRENGSLSIVSDDGNETATCLCRMCVECVTKPLNRTGTPAGSALGWHHVGVRRIALPLAFGGLAAAVAAGFALAARPAAPPTGLHGVVTRGPVTPVCRSDVPCDAPVPGFTIAFDRPDAVDFVARRAKTDPQGRYRILLPAGIYTVSMPGRLQFGKTSAPRRVSVRPGHVDRIDFHIDTGIR